MAEQTIEDRALVAGIRARDDATIRRVVDAHASPIFRAARGAGLGEDEAADLVQETFVTFVETAPRFEGRSRVRTWLFGILYRKLAEKRRHLERQRRMGDIEETFERRFAANGRWLVPPAPADQPLIAGELRSAIGDCLDVTPLRQRMAFLLREIEGLTTDEIRTVLNVSESNVGVLLFRARNRLRECLETKGIGP